MTDLAVQVTAPPQREFRPGRGFWIAAGWLLAVVVLAALADLLPFADPNRTNPRLASQGPSTSHWFGTDSVGRDLLSRVVHGSRVSLVVAFSIAGISAVIGSALGFVAGYFRGRIDAVVVSTMDVLLAFPTLIFALALTTFLGPSQRNVVLALSVVAVPVFARVVRAQTLSYSEREFVIASRASGASDTRTLFTEVAPNVVPAIVAFGLVLAALAIVVEGTLSFLGLGVPLPTATWGTIVASGQGELRDAAHISLIPSAVMFLTVLALNTVGERLRSHFDATGGPT